MRQHKLSSDAASYEWCIYSVANDQTCGAKSGMHARSKKHSPYAKSQCVTVNPFDTKHDFDDLTGMLEKVEQDCERSLGMATMFVLTKAMKPPAWVRSKNLR